MVVPALWSHPDVMGGEVCLEGTVVRIRRIWELYASGQRVSAICAEFPHIRREAIEAAVTMVGWAPRPTKIETAFNFIAGDDHSSIDPDDAADIMSHIRRTKNELPGI